MDDAEVMIVPTSAMSTAWRLPAKPAPMPPKTKARPARVVATPDHSLVAADVLYFIGCEDRERLAFVVFPDSAWEPLRRRSALERRDGMDPACSLLAEVCCQGETLVYPSRSLSTLEGAGYKAV